jgi:DNA-directed RNA polymerase specialized sigma24 family protein
MQISVLLKVWNPKSSVGMTDKEFIFNVQNGGVVMQRAIEWFYHTNFNMVYQKISTKGMQKEEAIDAYADALTALVENIRENRFRGESKCSTYFMGIFNNKCIDLIRKNSTNKMKQRSISLEEIRSEIAQDEPEAVPGTDLGIFFERLSEVCRNVLMDWSDGYSMEDIAGRNGLKNAHTARSKRYNCLQQLMELFGEHPSLLEKMI